MYIPPHVRQLIIQSVQEFHERRRVVCSAKAVEMGFPPELGRAIYKGCMEAKYDKWDKAQLDSWASGLSKSFDRHDWQPLYDVIFGIYHDTRKTDG